MPNTAPPPARSPISNEGHFAAIVASSVDAIVSKDLDGNVQSWNAAAERIFGWSADEMIGHSIRRLIPADRQGEEDDILARIRAGEIVPKFETLRLHRSGHLIPVAITVSPIRDTGGRIVGASKIANDIGDMLEIRRRLQESEREFRTLANTIPQFAWMTDGDGAAIWFNDRWFDYTGTTLDEMKGWGWRAVHHPDHVDRVVKSISHSFATGEPWDDVFPLRGADGGYRWFLSRANPIRDEEGRIIRWFGTNTDITQQREDEERIRMLMQEVNHRSKNMMAVIQALVSRTADRQYADRVAQRLQALAANQDMLVRRNWTGAPIGELIRAQLAAVADLIDSRILISGDQDLFLSPAAAETIGLAIHELATNAAKYGALSNSAGKLAIAWQILPPGEPAAEPALRLQWTESDGPPVAAPANKGFGSVMIDHNPRYALGASVDFGYPAEGFHWCLTAPIARVAAA